MRRKHVMAMVIATAAVGLLVAGTRFGFAAESGGGTAGCAEIQQQIASGAQVNVAQAIQCDQQEFQALENARQAARAAGQKPAMENSATCKAVNARAATGDASLDFNLAFHCRQRERFANNVNAVNGNGPAKQLTSLCQGVQARLARGESVDRFQQTFCAQEAQGAGQDQAGGNGNGNAGNGNGKGGNGKGNNGNGLGNGGNGDAGMGGDNGAGMGGDNAGEAPPADAGNAGGNGEVVCQGNTVTTNSLGGAPGAASGTFPLGTQLRITNLDNNKSTTVPVTDVSGSCVLLNAAAFEQVREAGKFVIRNVRVERVG